MLQHFAFSHRFLLLCVLSSLMSCTLTQTPPKTAFLHFESVESIALPNPYPQTATFVLLPQYIDNDHLMTITMGINNGQSGICIYDLSTGRIVKKQLFPAPFAGKFIEAFTYVNPDSIFFAFAGTSDRYDSSIVCMNDRLQIQHVYSLAMPPFKRTSNRTLKDSLCIPFLLNEGSGLTWMGNGIIIGHKLLYSSIEKPLPHQCIASALDISTHKLRPLPIYFFPSSAYDKFKGFRHIHPNICTSLRHTPLFTLGFSPHILEYQPQNDTMIVHYAPTQLFDSIYPSPYPSEAQKKFIKKNGNYYALLTDKWRNQYIRIMQLPVDSMASMENQNKERWGIMVLDSSFKPIAEAAFPQYDIIPITISPKGILAFDNQKWELAAAKYGTDSVYFQIYALSPTQQRPDLPSKSSLLSPKAYLSSLGVKEGRLLVIPIGNSCDPCIDKLLLYLKKVPKPSDLHIVAVFETPTIAQIYLKSHPSLSNNPQIMLDKNGYFNHYFESYFNPQLFYIKAGAPASRILYDVNDEKSFYQHLK